MKKISLALIILIIVGICIPAVSAYDYEGRIELTSYSDSSGTVTGGAPGVEFRTFNQLRIEKIENWLHPRLIRVHGEIDGEWNLPDNSYSFPVNFKIGTTVIGTGTYGYFKTGSQGYVWIAFNDDWDIGSNTGDTTIIISPNAGDAIPQFKGYRHSTSQPFVWSKMTMADTDFKYILSSGTESWGYYTTVSETMEVYWTTVIKADYTVTKNANNLYEITVNRIIDGVTYPSYLEIWSGDTLIEDKGDVLKTYPVSVIGVSTPIKINIGVPVNVWENRTFYDEPTDEPTYPTVPTVLRTGTVTMTDNNGTTISGFDVTAINHYTGEEFTTSTQSDVAVITLPMDRTIEIRNPQTGVYEEAPVGYYRFYGQSPGYKMLYEDGIQVSVMPEKYGSYQLCDIRVTQESGYLTGKHQFQIRSRSDNSILQTGTISAKSATTDEWYNTSVTNGIASLILPYDTSNVISQYAGNYYVYATSPGYEDSDYGTQIVVMPHTVSEIHSIQLTPIGGIPPAGNVTLRIQVFSETGQGIPNAEIFIAGVLGAGADVWDTYTASSTGYLTVSVPGNSTYDIVASGVGYYDSARRVEVFTVDPALIEIKLYLSGMPTLEPTTQPTGWVTPTPTQTTPPIQEDNLIGLSVKGLAKGFGIDYDTALLMFGLMIIFGAGGMVMSSVKGGAMEFIAGSIVGTFVAFALGLIPIWIFIIIAVVFGAYVLRVFVQGSQ